MEKYVVLDGRQRLNTLSDNMQEKYKLIYKNAVKKTPFMLQLLEEDIQNEPDHYKFLNYSDKKVRKQFFSKTPLSNMYRVDVYYKGVLWPSTEHAYMYEKFDFKVLKKFFNDNLEKFEDIKEKLREDFKKHSDIDEKYYDMIFTIDNLEKIYSNPKINGIFIKKLSKEFENLNLRVENWEQIKLETLTTLNIIKYAVSSECRNYLKDTGNKKLVEWNTWNDTFWGVCKKLKKGKNYLGRVLEFIRDNKEFQEYEINPFYKEFSGYEFEKNIENIKNLTKKITNK